MLFAAVNSGIEFAINYIPVDEEAKDWMKRANDGLAVAADVAVGGGTSSAAIVTKAVLREVGGKVVPQDNATAQKVFAAGSAVAQAAAGSVGSGISSAAAASGQMAAGQVAQQAGAEVSAELAQSALEGAACQAAKQACTQVGGAGVGAGIGYAVDGEDGLQTGVDMGLAVGSGNLSESGVKLAGAAAGGAVGYAAGEGSAQERLAAMKAGASLGTKLGGTTHAASGLGTDLISNTAALAGQGAGAAARASQGKSAAEAINESEDAAHVAAGASGTVRDPSATNIASTAQGSANLGVKAAREDAETQMQGISDAAQKTGWTDELVSRYLALQSEDRKLAGAQDGLQKMIGMATRIYDSAQLGTFRPNQVQTVANAHQGMQIPAEANEDRDDHV